MRRLALTAVVLSIASCKRSAPNPSALVTDHAAPLVSIVQVKDPAASAQLVKGFYPVEAGAWRWTMKQFEVVLKPPPGAAENGAKLNLKLAVPEAIISKVGPVTLGANINGLALPPETYSKSGDYEYTRDVPAAALKGDAVAVQFSSDKGIGPTSDDARELSVIAVSVGLEPK